MQPANFDIELEELAGEAIGWIPLEDRVVITGLPDAGLEGENMLLLV
jgi:hypothetical protein